jgi:hypothetical protein
MNITTAIKQLGHLSLPAVMVNTSSVTLKHLLIYSTTLCIFIHEILPLKMPHSGDDSHFKSTQFPYKCWSMDIVAMPFP